MGFNQLCALGDLGVKIISRTTARPAVAPYLMTQISRDFGVETGLWHDRKLGQTVLGKPRLYHKAILK
jgi:hypothetical protein